MAQLSRASRHATAPRSIPIVSWLSRKNRRYYALAYVVLVVLAVWTLFPFYWQIATSLRADVDLYSPVVSLVPATLTSEHYRKVLLGSGSLFPTQFGNSLTVALGTTAIAIVAGAMGGYALTRLRFFARAGIARILVYAYLAPASVLFIPIFMMMNTLNLRDSLFGLALTHLTFSVPFATWMSMGYFKTIPIELEEAALVDGASRFSALWMIVMPLSAPAIVVVAVFTFTLSWNEFLYALVLIQSKERMTAPVGLTSYVVTDVFYWGQMMAAATIMSVPPLLLYFFGQRWVVAGWTAGAVKN